MESSAKIESWLMHEMVSKNCVTADPKIIIENCITLDPEIISKN
jgi:hypothetical protein